MDNARTPIATTGQRIALGILGAGAIAVTLIALQLKVFELDRYFVPKELVLHATALLAGGLVFARRERIAADSTDILLAVFVGWTALSALFATNHWLAQRALAVTLSGAVIFWCARSLSSGGMLRPLLGIASLAGAIAAATSLLQAYGVESEMFTLARAPGGTLGNRNFVAHLAAITLPATAWCTVTAKRPLGALTGYIGAGMLAAVLVLSRSRAAWLAVLICLMIVAVPLYVSRRRWNSRIIGGRFGRFLLAAVLGVFFVIVLPNDLNWKSDSPYLDSAKKVVDYSSGSGRGRIAQYRNSLEMAKADPLLGAGPGNWPVKYVNFAPRRDKSLATNGMTANPWPSSDWVAYLSERGIVPTLALTGVFLSLFLGALRRWSDLPDGDAVLAKVVLAATVVTTVVVSAFDAVLLLPVPALVAWMVLGAAAGVRRAPRQIGMHPRRLMLLAGVTGVLMSASVIRSGTMVVSMSAVGRGGNTAGWIRGALWDPGNYRINLRVAELQASRGRCRRAVPFARRASRLFPGAAAPKRILSRCR